MKPIRRLWTKISDLYAAFTQARRAPREIGEERLGICGACDQLGRRASIPICLICGCPIHHLVLYEENLPRWGCKHPSRHLGAGWAR